MFLKFRKLLTFSLLVTNIVILQVNSDLVFSFFSDTKVQNLKATTY